uniref:Uncharacterized protein n=1 Tax=Sphaerodactylus townsendi TaxID=933632 RepID=A0ACB8FMG7_9SAUR
MPEVLSLSPHARQEEALQDKKSWPKLGVGFKPAGGIRTAKDALTWLSLIKEELGDEWLKPELFRLGASTLLADIERQIYHHVTGRYAAYYDLPMA